MMLVRYYLFFRTEINVVCSWLWLYSFVVDLLDDFIFVGNVNINNKDKGCLFHGVFLLFPENGKA